MNTIMKTAGVIIAIIIFVWIVVSPKNVIPTLKVGVISPFSGFLADYGEEVKKGVNMVASSTPGIQFIFEDDKCEPKEAVSAFNKLVSVDAVSVIIGPGCGSPQEAVVPLVKNDSAVILVMSAASKDLYNSSNKNFFNVQYSLEDESAFIAHKLTELGYKKVALVTYKNAFSDTHVKAFKAAYRGQLFDHVILDETTDVSSEIAKIKAEKPEVIYAPDVSFFFAQGLAKLEQYGVKVPVYSSYVAELPAARTLVPNVIYSFPGDLGGSQGAVQELSRQAAEFAVEALKECKNTVACIRENLVASGKFDENGVYKRPFIVKQIQNGEAREIL